MQRGTQRIGVPAFYLVIQIIIFLTPPHLSLFAYSTKSCILAGACLQKKKTQHQNSRDQNMRYWHNEVEKTALGPSVHRVYHFTGTDPINKVLHWHWRTAEIEPMKEVLLLFYLLDQFTSPYYFKTKANFWLRCCGSTCETKHSNHWCYKTCQSFSNSFFYVGI